MTQTKNLLDAIFNTSEQDVEDFASVFFTEDSKKNVPAMEENDFERIRSGKPDKYKPVSDFKEQKSGFVKIDHSWYYDDYVWHIAPASHKKPWKVTLDRVVYAIAVTLNKHIPTTTHVDIFPPAYDWEIQEITVKAIDIRKCWNITDTELNRLTEELFEVLNTLL